MPDRILLLTDMFTPVNGEGDIGEMCFDADNLYICTSSKTWKKIALVNI